MFDCDVVVIIISVLKLRLKKFLCLRFFLTCLLVRPDANSRIFILLIKVFHLPTLLFKSSTEVSQDLTCLYILLGNFCVCALLC
jgi:hypothetical protein